MVDTALLDAIRSIVREEVATLRNEVSQKPPIAADKAADPMLRLMRHELKQLAEHIEQTKREISALQPQDAGASRIMAATSELDAIVSATERATGEILSAAEGIQTLMGKLARVGGDNVDIIDIASEVEGRSMEIFMACSFQDITGQRITKVVNTLRYLEQRVHAMVNIWGVDEGTDALLPTRPDDHRPDAHLLHGPALDKDRPSQSAIDAMFD